ncbi:MAG TPA: NAD(P)H-binding protein [Gammaproteobacteria bacterium]|nr:NAD(P)H-binding protein [Gammaproteobacteria bacterium]
MKLVITGASGQLARRAAELVLAAVDARDLILTTRTPPALASFAERGVSVRHADFADPRSLRAAFAGGERLLLVSATDLRERTAQHEAAIDAAKAAGVRHVIYTSGLKPEPPNPAVVAPSHHATEQALKHSGLGWTILRNSLYADYQLPEAKRAIETGELVHNRGRGVTAYVAREDCAAVAAVVLLEGGHENAVYEITGSEAFSADDLAALYAEVGGRAVRARALDDAAFVATLVGDAKGDDHLHYGAELVASFGRSIREGYMAGCTDAVATLTGRAPLTLRQVLAPLERKR